MKREGKVKLMKKKLCGVVLAAVLAAAQVVTAFAADSKTADVIVAGDSVGYYTVEEGSAEVFSYLGAEARDKILAVNDGTASLQSIADLAPDLADDLEGKSMVTPFFDLDEANGGVKTEDGNYLVTLQIPAMTGNMSNVKILYYNAETGAWEVITPSDINLTNKTVTFVVSSLPAPVSIIADIAGGDNAVGTSPKTGIFPGWAVLMGAGVVLALAGVTVYRKSRIK